CCYSVIGYEVSAPGVEQYKEFIEEAKHEKDEVIEHSYYQWVGVVLFLQALTFYISHLFWKIWEKSKTDHLCMLPLNILNEKMYVVFWFWLYLVAIFSALSIIRRMVLMVFADVRFFLLSKFQRLAEPTDLKTILDKSTYADWFVIHMLSKNIDPMHFREVIQDLAKLFNEKESLPHSNYEKQIDTNV
ncbi:hypothetical protein BLA29_004919, partial [Euroglyphus maynei]